MSVAIKADPASPRPQHQKMILKLKNSDYEQLIIAAVDATGQAEFVGQKPAGFLEKKAQEIVDH